MEEKKRSLGAFEVLYILMLAALLLMAGYFMGRPRVGVVDVGRVAKGLGLDIRIAADDQEWKSSAETDLRKIKEEFEALTKGAREQSAAKEATSAATKELYARSSAVQNRLVRHRQQVLATFRVRLQPYITEVARKRRLWTVFDRNARLYYVNAKVDITEDVIRRSKSFFEKETDLIDLTLFEGTNAVPETETEESATSSAPPAAD